MTHESHPEVLRGAGYSTYAVGKWHVGDVPAASPVARGFDEFYGYTDGHSADQWQPAHYQRLPAGRAPELKDEPSGRRLASFDARRPGAGTQHEETVSGQIAGDAPTVAPECSGC